MTSTPNKVCLQVTPHSPCPVVCIGAIHYDTLVHAREIISPETSTPAIFSAKPGGVATNVARSLNQLGAPTRLIGALGNDAAAETLTNLLKTEGIHLGSICRSGFATGQYVAFHAPDGSLTAACVDDRILSEAPSDLFDAPLEETKTSLSQAMWFVDANLPETLLQSVAARAPKGRLIANAVSNAKAPRLKTVLTEIFCLMLNRGEAIGLTGLNDETSNMKLINALRSMGANQIVLTQGAGDVLAFDGTEVRCFPTPAVKIVDVTGAGDALTAGTIAALIRGFPLADAVPFGLKVANLTLQNTGALAQDLSWEALQTF